MKQDSTNQVPEEFRATILDQNNRLLGEARVLSDRHLGRGIFYILSGVQTEQICKNAEFLRREIGESIPIHNLFVCPHTFGELHIHFSYAKSQKD